MLRLCSLAPSVCVGLFELDLCSFLSMCVRRTFATRIRPFDWRSRHCCFVAEGPLPAPLPPLPALPADGVLPPLPHHEPQLQPDYYYRDRQELFHFYQSEKEKHEQ